MIQSDKLEQSVLACMIIDSECALENGLLSIEDFTSDINKMIFNSISKLAKENKAIDYLTIYGDLNQTVDMSYLMQLNDSMPSTTNFKNYIEKLKDLTLKRKLYKLSDKMKDTDKTGKEIAELTEREIFNLQDSSISGEFTQAKDIVLETVEHMQKVYNGEINPGIMTGYPAIDKILRGMKKGDYILLAARPSMGKTALAMNIAEKLAFRDKTVAFFSLEMPKKQIIQRLILSASVVPGNKLSSKRMDDNDWDKIIKATSALLTTKLFIDDDAGRTVPEMTSMCRRLKRQQGLDIVFIDYLQQIKATEGHSRREQVEQVSRDLKRMAKELDVPVIVISSLSRANETRNDKKPILSDLRETGQIEFDADVVMFIHREEYYDPETVDKGIAEIIVAKQRNGPVGIAKLGWIGECTKFVDYGLIENRR